MKRRIVLIIVFLLLGAIVNVAVAWGIAYRANSRNMDQHVQFDDDITTYSSLFPANMPKPCIREVMVGFGARCEILGSHGADEYWEEPLDAHAVIAHIGWPFAAMRSFYFLHENETGIVRETSLFERGIYVDDWRYHAWFGPVFPVQFLPLRPILPGFIINTLFYAVLLWLLVIGPFAARRMIRRRRGQCEKCAYPVGVSPVCTECGAALQRMERPKTEPRA